MTREPPPPPVRLPPGYHEAATCEWCWKPIKHGFLGLGGYDVETDTGSHHFCDAYCFKIWQANNRFARAELTLDA